MEAIPSCCGVLIETVYELSTTLESSYDDHRRDHQRVQNVADVLDEGGAFHHVRYISRSPGDDITLYVEPNNHAWSSTFWAMRDCILENMPEDELSVMSAHSVMGFRTWMGMHVRVGLPRTICEPWFREMGVLFPGLMDDTTNTDTHVYVKAKWGSGLGRCIYEEDEVEIDPTMTSLTDVMLRLYGRKCTGTFAFKLLIRPVAPGSFRIAVELIHLYVKSFIRGDGRVTLSILTSENMTTNTYVDIRPLVLRARYGSVRPFVLSETS